MGEVQHEHQPVLVDAVLRLIDPQPGEVVLDGTVGLGGHAAAIVPRLSPGGRYVGLDLDSEMLRTARERLGQFTDAAVDLCHLSYADFPAALERLGLDAVDHMLLDLGVNSAQLTERERGFSFDADGPLDMRYDRTGDAPTAADLVNALPENELANLFYYNAQEGNSRKIAKRICQVRHQGRITTTLALARAVATAQGARGGAPRPSKINPATRVFQALRIAVNGELDNLRQFLLQVVAYLRPGGKLVIISFHSLEDREVKQFVREQKAARVFGDLTPRPVIAEPAERSENPRSRNAKLRVARKM